MDIDDVQSEIPDLRKLATAIDEALECAEGAETPDDVMANIDDAISQTVELLRQLRTQKKKAEGADDEGE